MHDPDRIYDRAGTKRKYSMAEHVHMRSVLEWWNTGAALDPESPALHAWIASIAKRARHDCTARSATLRSHFKGKAVA